METRLSDSAQIRQADHLTISEYGIPGFALMEHAGLAAAEFLLRHYASERPFVILAGPGNNGGDGLVIARYLYTNGRAVRIYGSHSPTLYKGDALTNYELVSELKIPFHTFDQLSPKALWESCAQETVWIDALLGTGAKSPLKGAIKEIIDFLAPHQPECIAIDLPSGLNADTGAAKESLLIAQHTLTFQLPKICQFVSPAAEVCGEVHVFDIQISDEAIARTGIQRFLLDDGFIQTHVRPRDPNTHKNHQGHLLVIGGSGDMAGSVALTALAASRSGVGLCTVLTPGNARQTVLNWVPEAMCPQINPHPDHLSPLSPEQITKLLHQKDAVVMGMGIGQHSDTLAFLQTILPLIKVPLLLDADALNLLAANEDLWSLLPEQVILTPHPGEMSRLSKRTDVQANRLETAESFAKVRGVVTVLKGKGTLIASPDGTTYVNTTGNPGMGTAGSGDVLAGMIGKWLSAGHAPEIAASLGVWLHGKAGDLAAAKYGTEGISASLIAKMAGIACKTALSSTAGE